MGLQPKRIGGHEEKDGAAAFRIALGQAIATIDRPGDAALAAADPADRGTSSLATSLPSGWASVGTCWRVTPGAEDAAAVLTPAATRGFFKLVVPRIDLSEGTAER